MKEKIRNFIRRIKTSKYTPKCLYFWIDDIEDYFI